jgi:hypothetical protein
MSPEDIRALYVEAVHAAHTAETPTDDDVFVDPVTILCEDAALSQSKLRGKLLDVLPEAVKAAASRGKYSTALLEFSGSDKFDDNFSYLFLLKGPRDTPQQNDLAARGFVPLYTSMYHELRPFVLNYQWTPGTNSNALSVSWLPHS